MNDRPTNELVSYAVSHCETWLEILAKTHAVSYAELSARVFEVFQNQNEELGLGRVPEVSQISNGTGRSKGIREMALRSDAFGDVSGTAAHDQAQPRRRQLSAKARKAISDAQKARWRYYHDSQADEKYQDERRQERKRTRWRDAKKKSRQKKQSYQSRSMSSYWAGMSKEDRSIEMKRRRAAAAAKRLTGA